MPYLYSADLRRRVERNIRHFTARAIDHGSLRRAAVAVVVVRSDISQQAALLLTYRTAHLKRHSNQFAFPGGRMDEGETPEEAALRECHEEIGLELPASAIIGRLDDFATRSGFRMTPVVVWGGEVGKLSPDPNEVDEVFRIPFQEIDSPDIPHLGPALPGKGPVMSAPLPTIGGLLHAPTAAILYQFREVALHGRPTRVAHFDQPQFAWK
jgi:8-oxo-dGTP pyrophosphatase MutT (NUDIX family)